MNKPLVAYSLKGFILCTTIDIPIMKYTSLLCSHIKETLVLFFVCTFFIATLATAQTETSSSTAVSLDNSEQFVDPKPEEDREQTKLSGAKQTRIINLCANISNRFEATLARLENITKRLEARMRIMNTQGLQVDDAAILLLEVQTTLNTARVQLENIDSEVFAVATGDNPQSSWKQLRTTFTKTYKTIQQAQEQLKEVVILLKNSTVPTIQEVNSTTTTEANSI